MTVQLDSDGTDSPLATVAKHWKSLIGATFFGALIGAGIGSLLPTHYTAEARLAVGAGSDSAYAIPGFPLAARELASNYSRWVQNGITDGSWAQPETSSVSATPIPDSGVIRVEAKSPNEQAAVEAAAATAARLKALVDEVMFVSKPESALNNYRKKQPAVAKAWELVATAEETYNKKKTDTNRKALAAARLNLNESQLLLEAEADRYRRLIADPKSVSQITIIAPAVSTGNNHASNLAFGTTAGSGLAMIVSFVWLALQDKKTAVVQ